MLLDATEEKPKIQTECGEDSAEKKSGQIQLQHTQANEPLGSANEMRVTLKFQIGSVELPFKDLKQLGSGYSFDLQKRLIDQPVSILANDMLFANGELVCIGDFIGVRITRLSPKSG